MRRFTPKPPEDQPPGRIDGEFLEVGELPPEQDDDHVVVGNLHGFPGTAEEFRAFISGGPPTTPLPVEEQISRLDGFCARYLAPCRFEVGDLVIARKDGPEHPDDAPSIVIEVRDLPRQFSATMADDFSEARFGMKLDMRVMHFGPTNLAHCHWVESWAFVPWDSTAMSTGDAA